jgi:hypothetical protein
MGFADAHVKLSPGLYRLHSQFMRHGLDFYGILRRLRESHWVHALNFDNLNDTESRADESLLSAYRVDFYLPSSPTKSAA